VVVETWEVVDDCEVVDDEGVEDVEEVACCVWVTSCVLVWTTVVPDFVMTGDGAASVAEVVVELETLPSSMLKRGLAMFWLELSPPEYIVPAARSGIPRHSALSIQRLIHLLSMCMKGLIPR